MQTLMRLQRIRIAPRKMRMVIDLVRGKKVAIAKDVLRFTKNRGARILSKLLDSVVSMAKQLGQGDELNLMVSKITVDEGPKLKRWRARARGSAFPIQKKVSHITIVLDEVRGGKSIKETGEELKAAQMSEPIKEGHIAPKVEKPKFKAVSSERKVQKSERGVRQFFRRKAIG